MCRKDAENRLLWPWQSDTTGRTERVGMLQPAGDPYTMDMAHSVDSPTQTQWDFGGLKNAAQGLTAMKVIIDTREEDLWKLLEPWLPGSAAAVTDGWTVERKPLEVGDIAFVREGEGEVAEEELVLLERKTAEDLGASQKDGRYREQRARLLAKRGGGTAIGYLLEAPAWSPTLSRTWCRGAFSEVNLQTTIVRLQMRYTIPVFQSTGLKESVAWIRRIAASLKADPTVFKTGLATEATAAAAAYKDAIHVKKAANMDASLLLTTVLRTVPGVGAAAADAIMGHVGGSFPAFYALGEAELAAIPLANGKRKLGAATAGKLWAAFHTPQPLASASVSEDVN